jgi:hypothetical protein
MEQRQHQTGGRNPLELTFEAMHRAPLLVR